MRLGLHGVGKQVILLLSCHIWTRHETGLVSPWKARQRGHMGPVCILYGILGNGKALRKMQSSALVRRYSFLLSSQGLRKLRRNSEKWKNFMYIESHNQISREITFFTILTMPLYFPCFSPFCRKRLTRLIDMRLIVPCSWCHLPAACLTFSPPLNTEPNGVWSSIAPSCSHSSISSL